MAESEPGASAEGRININDVPEQISRIFFGQGSSRPHYTDDSYGVPGLSVPGFGLSPGPLLYRGEAVSGVSGLVATQTHIQDTWTISSS